MSDLGDAPGQQKALDAILDAWGRGEQIRTVQELADKLGIAKSRAHNALTKLAGRGFIEREMVHKRARTASIRPTEKGAAPLE